MTPAAVLGGGSWGTSLAWLLGGKGLPVRLWCRSAAQAEAIRTEGENAVYLPGTQLPDGATASADLAAVVREGGVLVVAVPTSAVAEVLRAAARELPPGCPVVLAAKGLERDTGRRLSQVARDELPGGTPLAVLSGPNLAAEIVRGVPTATVVAAEEPELARALQALFSTPAFRVYTSADVPGVELGGALKNPIALAAGMTDGLGYGANTRASLLTRGLAEMRRLGVAAGGRGETFNGLSGLGDLIATAHSPLSRNYRLGRALGLGESLEAARQALGQVAEGVPTTSAACLLADRLAVDTPILHQLRAILYEGKPPREAVTELMLRPGREESG